MSTTIDKISSPPCMKTTDYTDPVIHIDPTLCTGCRRCAEVCPVDAIEGLPGEPQTINADRCVICGQCVQICSVYASDWTGSSPQESAARRLERIQERDMPADIREPLFAAYYSYNLNKVSDMMTKPGQFRIVQCAPAIRVSLAEEFGMPFGTLTPGKMAAALRRLGFDRVYDTNFGADVTIMEEGTELIRRVTEGGPLPMFTSCCPAWVRFAEIEYPDLLDHLSSCKSPMQMLGALIKSYGAQLDEVEPANIYSVAIMPCTCKQFECDRPEMESDGYRDVDEVLTTRELAYWIKQSGIDFANLPDEEFDSPLGQYSGAGSIFGVTGGVMEAAIRTGYELLTNEKLPKLQLDFVRGEEGIRVAEVQVGKLQLKVAVVAGLQHAYQLLDRVQAGECDYHFIEVMGCPAGCISGGGQPKIMLEKQRIEAYRARKSSIYGHDAARQVRKSHENPHIIKLYDEFLGEPLGHVSHHLLHTTFQQRGPGKQSRSSTISINGDTDYSIH